MPSIDSFSGFLSEADLRGNVGIPGEEGAGQGSWLDRVGRELDAENRAFAARHGADIRGFMGLVSRSQSLQRGHEEALSELTEESFKELFGSLLDGVALDFRIATRDEVAAVLAKTPTKSPAPGEPGGEEEEETERAALSPGGEEPGAEPLAKDLEGHVHKRKILRTVQQGKGLSTKAILNLSLFRDGVAKIMGPDRATEYLDLLNRVSAVAQFFDQTIPEEQQAAMWQTRGGFAGAADIKFTKGPEPSEAESAKEAAAAEDVLAALERGQEASDIPEGEDLLSHYDELRIIARGVDLSVLVHEAVKAVYKLLTQASLESLYGRGAEEVLLNTDTLLDELQEIKYGKAMQAAFFKAVRESGPIRARLDEMLRADTPDREVAAFQERVDYLFFSEVSQIGSEDPSEFLELVNGILSESDTVSGTVDAIAARVLDHLDQEAAYQEWERGASAKPGPAPEPTKEPASRMTKDEIADAIIDAYQRGDEAEVARLRLLLKESISAFSGGKI